MPRHRRAALATQLAAAPLLVLVLALSLGQMHAAVYGQSVTSQGAYTVESHVVNSLGNNGSGIKVAIIDAGFDVTDEEISSNIAEARSFRSNGDITAGGRTAHGTATAQIVVDVAPDVELYLYNIESVPNMIRLIDYIIGRGDIDIVSLSVAWWGVGPYDGTSGLSQKVSEAQDSGILWISAAGNYADSHWEGMFADADADGFHNFGSVDETISFFAAAGSVVELELTWDDAWGRSSNDYELRLFDANLNLLISSIETQDGDDDPLETIQYLVVSDGIYNIVIERYSGEARNLELFSFEHSLTEHNVPGGSVIIPADAVGTVAVAAVGHDTESLKLYSSRGPTNDGRTKPDVAGPTDVITSTYDPFGGTSAAAPHVAGVAALIKSANPTYTPAQIQSVLEDTTRNHHAKGNEDGTGLANALNAMGLPLAETFETDLSAWTEEGGAGGWSVGPPGDGGHPPGHHDATNTVARAGDGCASECRLVLSDGLDLTGYDSAAMTLYRYVDDGLDDGEYLRVDVSENGGTSWTGAYDWQGDQDGDDTWTMHTLDLADHLDSDSFKVRLSARASQPSGEGVMVDTLIIDGVASRQVPVQDTAPPSLVSVTLNEATWAMTITFSETVDVSKTDISRLYVSDENQEDAVSLDGAGFDGAEADSATISLTLTPAQFVQIIAMAAPQLDIGAGAVSDVLQNPIGDSPDHPITVTGVMPNAPPVAPSETATTAEDTPVTITPTISDPDMSDTPVISAVADPPNGTATHGDDTITYTPDADYEGTDSFGYTVSDGTDTTDGTITVTVTRANNAPVLGTIGDRDATVGAQLTITPSVTDADTTDAHTFTISRGTLPAAAAFSTSAGSITWTPVQADAGQTHTVTITVNDGRGGTDSETFDIVVTELLEAAGAHLEFENDLTDSSGAHGGTIQSGSVSYAAGPVGRAVMLDNTHVTLAGEPDLDFDTDEAFSIAFWINKDHEPSSTVSLVSKSERFWRQGTDIWFNPNAGGKASLRLSDGSAYMEIRTPGSVADGTWHHVAFTYDGSGTRAGMSVYVDGQPVTEITAGATSLSGSILNDHPVGIGASSTGLDPAGNTSLDELHIRPGQMSASEVSALHAQGSSNTGDMLELFVDSALRYTIQYPSSWLVNDDADNFYDDSYMVGFYSDDIYAWLEVYLFEVDYAQFSESRIFEEIIEFERQICNSASFDVDGFICYDFLVLDSYTSLLDSGLKAYNVEYSSTHLFDISAETYDTRTHVAEIHDGTNAWLLVAETDYTSYDLLEDLLNESINSFELTRRSPAPHTGAHLAFEGDLTDSSGMHEGTVRAGSVSYAAGPVGRAAILDNTHVTLAGEPDLDFDTDEAFSIAFWVNKDHEPSSTVSLVSKSERFWRQGTDIWFNPNAGGKASLRLSDGSAYMEVRTPGSVADGTWHHVAFTYDGSGNRGGMSVYVDGQPVTGITAGATSLSGSILNDHPVGIGASSTGLDPAGNTSLDELHIRPGQMSASEVSALHAAGSPPAPPETAGAHLAFEGDLTDSSGMHEGTVRAGSVSYAAGPVGRAAILDNTHVTLAGEPDLDFDTDEAFSIAFWVNKDHEPSSTVSLVSKSERFWRQGTDIWFNPNAGGKASLRLSDGSAYMEVRTPGSVADGTWHHVAFTYDGSGTRAGMSVYVDGQPVTGITAGATSLSGSILNDHPVGIGASSTGLDPAGNTSLDELHIRPGQMSASEVSALHAAGSPPAPPETAGAHLAFEGDLTDSSGMHEGTVRAGSVSYAAGPVGRAAILDNTHVTLAGEPDLDFDTDEAFSIAFWVNKDHEPSSTVSLVSKSERFWRQGTDIWFNPNAGGKASLRLSDGSAYMEVRTPGSVADGTWHHVAFTYDGSGTRAGMSVYVDGQPVTGITAGATSLSGSILNDHPVGIGASSTGLDPAGNTSLDELHIRPGQMSASEVSALHAAGSLA